jgi:enterochelin esterase-like enzyme
MPTYQSNYLNAFLKAISEAHTEEERDTLWNTVVNPILQDIPDQTHKLVTFLYRLGNGDLDHKTSIYFLSSVTGYNFTEQSKFSVIPQTDIAYISLVLPCQLRSTYNLVKRRDDDNIPVIEINQTPSFYPRIIGDSAKFDALENDLREKNRVTSDPLNTNEIIYYKDMDSPEEFYGKESILELPAAPCLEAIPTSYESIKSARDRLKHTGRLIQDRVIFSDTCLKNVLGYDELSSTRKYWIYLPKNYDPNADAYPFMLFLDGSSYLDYIPAHCILEKMIEDKVIPPCVAVFFDNADGAQRSVEYNCNDRFTEFLAQDFMEILRVKHTLNITTDPKHASIIGASFSGLAAFYAGLKKPDRFGHVIAQSPALSAQRLTVLDRMITDFSTQNSDSSFIFEMGCFENSPIEFEFGDGTIQSISSLDAVRHVYDHMKQEQILVDFHEFVGGHNYICFRVSLYDRIKEVYQHQLQQVDDADSRHLRRFI